MSFQVAIFEDDKDLADILKERMEIRKFEVTNYYSLTHKEWKNCDIVLGDFRNKIVDFQKLKVECQREEIPLIAISGAETGFQPQLLKPFTIEELESAILQQMMRTPRGTRKKKPKGILSRIFRKG